MEVLTLLSEAKAYGLSKDEFFQLVDLQLKMNESIKQASPGITSSGDGLGSGGAHIEKLVQEICENQQRQQHQMFAEMLDKQKQYLQNEFQNFQKQLLQQQDVRLKQHQHTLAQQNELLKCNLQAKGDLSGRSLGSLDPALLDMKDKFHEMRNTVLSRLEEEKVFMRDALSKAQNDTLTLLSKTVQEVNQMKEAIGADDIAQIGKKVGQICVLCEELSNGRNQQGYQEESTEGAGSSQVIQDSMILLEDLNTKIEDKLEQSVDCLKQEIKEVKEAHSAEIPNKVVQDSSINKDDNSFPYYFCINNFKNCIKHEESIENNLMYVDKLGVYVKGYVQFFRGEMEVWISYISNHTPDHVWYLPVPHGEIVVKATIVDMTGKFPIKDLGEKLFSRETVIFNNDRPFLIGTAKCDELFTDGFLLHDTGAVLLKYVIVMQDGFKLQLRQDLNPRHSDPQASI